MRIWMSEKDSWYPLPVAAFSARDLAFPAINQDVCSSEGRFQQVRFEDQTVCRSKNVFRSRRFEEAEHFQQYRIINSGVLGAGRF
jgi:hypothetical protein